MAGGIANWAAERGAATIEYGVIVSLIAVVALLVVGAMGVEVFAFFDTVQFEIELPGPLRPSM
jgi:Flp pilus assembly pilin Flp